MKRHPLFLRIFLWFLGAMLLMAAVSVALTVFMSQQGIILNVVVGIIGGFLGGWLLPTLGLGLGGGWVGFLITAFIGAVVLLLIVNLFTRGRAR